MTENDVVISAKVANHALNYRNRDEGFSGGWVSEKFFELCAHADDDIKSRLALGFPSEIAAFEIGRKPGGIAALRIIAAKLTLVE